MGPSLEDQILYADSLEIRRNAAISLSKDPKPETIPVFLQALSDSEDVSIFAVYGLVKIGERAVPAILDALQSSSHHVTRAACVEVLGEICDGQSLPVLLKIAEEEVRNVWVQSAAIQAVARYKDPRVDDLLLRLLSHHDSWIMTLSSVYLHRRHYKDEDLFRVMLERFTQPDELRRGVIAWGLVEVGRHKDVPLLKAAIQSAQDAHLQKMLYEIQKQILWKKD